MSIDAQGFWLETVLTGLWLCYFILPKCSKSQTFFYFVLGLSVLF